MGTSPRDNLPTYQKALLQVATYRTFQATMGVVLGRHNLNTTQWIILGMVSAHPKQLRITDIAQALQVEGPLVTNLAKTLIAGGLLVSSVHARDSRARILELTEPGRQLVGEIEVKLAKKLTALEKGLNEEEVTSYFKALEKLVDNASPSSTKLI